MRACTFIACLVFALATGGQALAQSKPTAAVTDPGATAARDAAQVADAFMASLVAGDFEKARAHMTPEAVVVANGQAIGLRDAYIDGAAKADAAALRSVRRELLRRDARAGIDVAWIVSEKRVRPANAPEGNGPGEVVMETVLLAKIGGGWKITHVHWSGRRG